MKQMTQQYRRRSRVRKEQVKKIPAIVKSFAELLEDQSEITGDLLSIAKSINTRLYVLETTVQHIDESFIKLIDNLQKQVDVLAANLI